jgi:hypothetical protein
MHLEKLLEDFTVNLREVADKKSMGYPGDSFDYYRGLSDAFFYCKRAVEVQLEDYWRSRQYRR